MKFSYLILFFIVIFFGSYHTNANPVSRIGGYDRLKQFAEFASYTVLARPSSEFFKELSNGVSAGEDSLFMEFEVWKILKGKMKKSRLILRLNKSYSELSDPDKLKSIHRERLRMKSCQSVLKKAEIGSKSMNDCPNDASIKKILTDPEFIFRSRLGWILELGWDMELKGEQTFVLFLNDSENGAYEIINFLGILPVSESTALNIEAQFQAVGQ